MDVAARAAMVKGGSKTALCLSVIAFLFMPSIAKQESPRAEPRSVEACRACISARSAQRDGARRLAGRVV